MRSTSRGGAAPEEKNEDDVKEGRRSGPITADLNFFLRVKM